MIIFDLECLNGHTFEGWFEDRNDFIRQQEEGILTCPVCETTSVVQKLSAVSIKTSSSHGSRSLEESRTAIAELAERVSEYVEKNFENVGTAFTKEALKMHYGAIEYRNIRGTTTREEDKILDQEGVPVLKIPLMKKPDDDLN